MLAKALKIIWILSALAILAVTIVRYAPGPASDIGVFFIYSMLLLSFPVGLVVAALLTLLALLQDHLAIPLLDLISSNDLGFCVMWFAFFVAGYLQWFVLLPRLWRKWKTRVSKSRPLSQ